MEQKQIASKLKSTPGKAAFAKASGVSRSTLYRIINGWKNPGVQTLQAIERQLEKMDRNAARNKE